MKIKNYLETVYKFGKRIKPCIHYVISLVFIYKNKKCVKRKIINKEKLNVVFIIQYIPSWNKIEPVYNKMKQDDRFMPIILCVPSNIRNGVLLGDDCRNDTFEYFVSHGFQVQNALKEDGQWMNLRDMKPDYVFHSRPYNSVMPKCYTSGEIRKYALLCNVLYGANMTENGQLVTLNRNYFRDVFCYFSFDNAEMLFYENRLKPGIRFGIQKCLPYGATGLEQMMNFRGEKRESQFFKTVLWTPRWATDSDVGGSNFFRYKDLMINLVQEHSNILFVFRPHPLMFGNFIQTGEMTEQEVKDFKKFCKVTPNLVLDETKEYADIFWGSDFIIADSSAIVAEYFVTKKPVLYCHSMQSLNYCEYAREMISCCYEVKNETDLLKYFSMLLDDNDLKYEDRMNCINKYFCNVEDNSKNIVSYLVGI